MKMKEYFKHRWTTFLSICLLLAFNNHFGSSTDEHQLKRCCDASIVNSTECRSRCNSYLEKMNGTDACVTDFNRILKCKSGAVNNRERCCRSSVKSSKCAELCLNYDKWIANFTSNCSKERQETLLCFVETVLPDVPPTIIRIGIIESNNQKRIECEARGKPNVTYRWEQNNRPFLRGTDKRTIEFDPVTDSDEGYYQCFATNIHGTAVSDFKHLRKRATDSTQEPVRGAPVFNDITDGPYNVIATEGCNVTFRCNAVNASEVKWYRDGEELNAGGRFEISSDKYNLTIRNVCRDCRGRKSDLMVIQCNASNSLGYAFRSGSLNILKATKVTTDNDTQVVAEAERDTNRTVCCRAVSDPVVSLGTRLTWYRKGEDGRCSEVAEWQQGDQTGIMAHDKALVIRIAANDTEAWTKFGGEYVCVGQHRNSRHEQVVTVNPNARVDLKLDLENTTDRKGVVFVCSFRSWTSNRAVEFQKFRWYLNSVEILNPIRQSIDNTKAPSGCSKCISKLTFPSIPSQYSGGRVRCSVEYWSQMSFSRSREGTLPVAPPEVSIKSSIYDVYQDKNFNLTCNVTNFDKINATEVEFHWYQDDQLKSTDASNSQIFTKSWSLKEEKSPVSIGCRATMKHGNSDIQNATIRVVKEGDKVCSPDTDPDQNIEWPLTKMGGIAKSKCPGDKTGECSRECKRSSSGEPEWLDHDCSRCVDPKLTSIIEKIESFEEAIGNNNRSQVANVVKSLSDFTNQTVGLKYGDLSESVNAVAGLVRLQKKNEGQLPEKKEVEWAVKVISNLLEPANGQSWTSLKQGNKSSAATLMAFGDSYGQGLTQIINQTDGTPVIEAKTQVVLEAVSKKVSTYPQNFAFPSPNGSDWGESSDRISLNVYEQDIAEGKDSSSLNVWSLHYRNINEFLPNESNYRLDSRVLSLSVGEIKKETQLKESVRVTLQHVSNNITEKHERKCAYWKFESEDVRKGSWSSEGCKVVESNENQTVCHCSHLTNFAILMSLSPSDAYALSILTKIGCGISIACLALTIIIYAVTWKQVKSHQAAVLLNLCVALLIAYLVFLLGSDKVDVKDACKAVAVLLHYFFLAAFCLMLAEGVQLFICVYFVFHVRQRRETAALIVAGWVLPLIIVAVSLGITRTDGYGRKHENKVCWLSTDGGLLWAFAGPVLVITAINIVIIVAVLRKIVFTRVVSNKKDHDNSKIRKMAWSMAVLCPVLGIAWLFGVLSIASNWIGFQYIFTIANSFQGLFIFIFHGLYNNKKSSEKISSFVSEVMSRTPFKRRQDTTVTSTSSQAHTDGRKASSAAQDISMQDKRSQMDSSTDTFGKGGNDCSDFTSTSEPEPPSEPRPSDASVLVHSHDTTTPL